MKFILGKKIEMTQLWRGDKVVPVTKIVAGPCYITQIKTVANDGYGAFQIGFGKRKEKNIAKPQKGHMAKSGQTNLRSLREGRATDLPEAKVGEIIRVETFAPGDLVMVSGISKGKGFQGVVKRHGFHGFRKTHGNKDQERASGSIGAKGPAHVFKGMRMPGQMGNKQITSTNLEIVEIDEANNWLFIKGAVPGGRNSLLFIKGQGELKFSASVENIAPEVLPEEEIVEGQEPVVEVMETPEGEVVAEEVVKTEEAKIEEVKEENNEEAKKEEEIKTE